MHELRLRRGVGHHQAPPSATPTTRCCPRRWKAGRCRCSSGCCPGTCRSSMRSTPAAARGAQRRGRSTIARSRAISLIDEGGERRVRMANLAFAGSHSVNGVAALHTELMKQTVFADLHRLYPDADQQQDQRHHARAAGCRNAIPALTALIREAIGDGFLDDAEKLADLAPFADDAAFRERFAAVKRANKVALADHLKAHAGAAARSRRPVRRADQAHPRIQAPAAQHHRDGRALRPDPRPSRTRLDAAGQDLRRQGGVELSQRQADHQAGQRRRAADQRRSVGRRPAEGRRSCPTTTSRWPR